MIGRSGYRGVTWNQPHPNAKPWRVRVCADGREYYAGHYRTPVEAARAYNEHARLLLGERAKLNEVPG